MNDAAAMPEKNVSVTEAGVSPAERVQVAVAGIPADMEPAATAAALADGPSSSFRRWTVRDFHSAYSSGQTTPVMVIKQPNQPFFFVLLTPAGHSRW
jgi:hypothetical protein